MLSLIAVLAGVIMIGYPLIGKICTFVHNTATIDEYQNGLQQMTSEEIEEAKNAAKDYNDAQVENSGKYNALNIGDVIGYIDIPKIDVYIPIYNNTREDTLQMGIGHLENTSLPVGGGGTHCVLTGHSGLTGNRMFTDLEKLEIGDEFYVHTLDEILTYKVDEINVALPEEAANYITMDRTHDYCTLLTCTPVGINTHRLLVRGTHTDTKAVDIRNDSGSNSENGAEGKTDGPQDEKTVLDIILSNWFWWLLILVFLTGATVAAIIVKKKEN